MQKSQTQDISINDILAAEMQAIQSIPQDNDYEGAIQIILKHIHSGRKGRLITSGMGKAGQIALNIATTFSSTGTPAYFLHPSEAQHGDLGMICPDDVLLVISNSGKTTILITGHEESPLVGEVDVVLYTGNPKEVCPLGLTPTTSTTVMTVLGDILVVQTMQRIGFCHKEYALRHHGGYLGSMSRQLSACK